MSSTHLMLCSVAGADMTVEEARKVAAEYNGVGIDKRSPDGKPRCGGWRAAAAAVAAPYPLTSLQSL